jgi:HPt (histidine-containing phosphotransfer) domain-containing protein
MKFSPKSEPALLAELSKIEGLDINAGLGHLGDSAAAYFDILRRFCAEYDRCELEVKLSLEREDWKNYTIRVHAMKGVFGTIGVDSLFQWARKLELASRAGDYDPCRRETADLCGAMRAFRESLAGTSLIGETEAVPKIPAASGEARKKLSLLRDACARGDSDEADELAAGLAGMGLGNEDADRSLDEICANARNLDYDLAVEKAGALLAILPP